MLDERPSSGVVSPQGGIALAVGAESGRDSAHQDSALRNHGASTTLSRSYVAGLTPLDVVEALDAPAALQVVAGAWVAAAAVGWGRLQPRC